MIVFATNLYDLLSFVQLESRSSNYLHREHIAVARAIVVVRITEGNNSYLTRSGRRIVNRKNHRGEVEKLLMPWTDFLSPVAQAGGFWFCQRLGFEIFPRGTHVLFATFLSSAHLFPVLFFDLPQLCLSTTSVSSQPSRFRPPLL